MDPVLVWLVPYAQVGGGPIYPPAAPGQPPTIWPSPGYPAHPIAPGGPPPQVGGGPIYPPSIWPTPPGPGGPGLTPPPTPPPPQAAPTGFKWGQAVVPEKGWEWVAVPTPTAGNLPTTPPGAAAPPTPTPTR